jgi:hypothetical protein
VLGVTFAAGCALPQEGTVPAERTGSEASAITGAVAGGGGGGGATCVPNFSAVPPFTASVSGSGVLLYGGGIRYANGVLVTDTTTNASYAVPVSGGSGSFLLTEVLPETTYQVELMFQMMPTCAETPAGAVLTVTTP